MKIGSLASELRNATTEMNDLSYKYKCLQRDKESAEYIINKLSRNVQEKEKEISLLIEDLAKTNENEDREEHAASANTIQKLKEENASLNSKLSQLSQETEKKVCALTKEIKGLQKSKGTSSEEYNARKLYEENEFLKARLDRRSRSYKQLRKDYKMVNKEKDHALNSYEELRKDYKMVERKKDCALNSYEELRKDYKMVERKKDRALNRYNEKIRTLTKTVEDIKGSINQAADENIKGLQMKIGALESELRNATTE